MFKPEKYLPALLKDGTFERFTLKKIQMCTMFFFYNLAPLWSYTADKSYIALTQVIVLSCTTPADVDLAVLSRTRGQLHNALSPSSEVVAQTPALYVNYADSPRLEHSEMTEYSLAEL